MGFGASGELDSWELLGKRNHGADADSDRLKSYMNKKRPEGGTGAAGAGEQESGDYKGRMAWA